MMVNQFIVLYDHQQSPSLSWEWHADVSHPDANPASGRGNVEHLWKARLLTYNTPGSLLPGSLLQDFTEKTRFLL